MDPEFKGLILQQFPGAYEKTRGLLVELCEKYDSDPQPPSQPLVLTNEAEGCKDQELTGAQRLLKRGRLMPEEPASSTSVMKVMSKAEIEIQKYENWEDMEFVKQPLEFWYKNRFQFKLLVQVAKEYLVIPASSATSERAFSAGTQVFYNCLNHFYFNIRT